ncbi:hypothetical protein HMPREF2787_09165 [Corynebacterium sp. HMSC061H03]|uniref:hypothetical protein n=1 Tax=Corynebacterium sp. HMSC061H03 TaxID=1739291 RepID=UPI0008A8BFBF|nr:hypothetical protein [Corynebacterium sp. HMSC061H03]OHR24499.1 hypothetical protein HMPREF2787_09165 [Corynebacterium sp. HMSC061H03]
MRNRIAGAIAASAIAAAALVACSPPNQVDSDVKVGDQANPSKTFEQKATTPASSEEMPPAETAEM